MRLVFQSLSLGRESILRITSTRDSAVQELTAEELQNWRHTSAYFNGNAVLLELVAGPRTVGNEIQIEQLLVETPTHPKGARTDTGICGATDDRQLTREPAVFRLDTKGLLANEGFPQCTAFLVNRPNRPSVDKCFLTAGHCVDHLIDTQIPLVVEFDVPLSNSDCTPRHPSPDKQFVVNHRTITFRNSLNEDWAVFHVFPNNGTTPYMANGGRVLTLGDGSEADGSIEVLGYGGDANEGDIGPDAPDACGECDTPNGLRYNVLQSSQGTAFTCPSPLPGNVCFRANICEGASGAPIIDIVSNHVIGIVSGGNCTFPGFNYGTRVNWAAFSNLLQCGCN